MPQRVVKLAPDAEEGIFYDEDGNIRLVVTGPIEIIAYPEFSEEFPIKRAVETYDSALSMGINDEGNFTINRVEAVEGADTAASQRFVGRPSVSAVNVSNEPTVNDEGWRFSPSPYLDNVEAVAFIRKDESGELWEQQLINRPADWFGFKAALLAMSEVNKVTIDIEGVISIVFRGELVRAMTAYEVELNATSNKPGRPLVFLNAGDRNGDGAEDYYVYYPDGSRQLIYLLPQP